MKKINIAELLKDCPQGMELYSPIFGEVYLDEIRPHLAIVVTTNKEQGDFKEEFLYDGRYGMNGECMLFPSKNKTTWEDFVPPCKFKDGDIVAATIPHTGTWVGIFKQYINNEFESYCFISANGVFNNIGLKNHVLVNSRLATEEEKTKLFQAIKDNGYHWNAGTNTLEKLIKPEFKIGDKIRHKTNTRQENVVTEIKDTHYILDDESALPFIFQDQYVIIPNKFDITTLKPFDKVLMRSSNAREWTVTLYSHYNNNKFYGCGMCCDQCIPYEHNEHLRGTTNDCDDFYKTW